MDNVILAIATNVPAAAAVLVALYIGTRVFSRALSEQGDRHEKLLTDQAERYEAALIRQSERHERAEQQREERLRLWREEDARHHDADRVREEAMTNAIKELTSELRMRNGKG